MCVRGQGVQRVQGVQVFCVIGRVFRCSARVQGAQRCSGGSTASQANRNHLWFTQLRTQRVNTTREHHCADNDYSKKNDGHNIEIFAATIGSAIQLVILEKVALPIHSVHIDKNIHIWITTFSIQMQGTEQLVILFEMDPQLPDSPDIAIRQAAHIAVTHASNA